MLICRGSDSNVKGGGVISMLNKGGVEGVIECVKLLDYHVL